MNEIITEYLLEINPQDRCHEEDLKMEEIIKVHYDAAIRVFNDYWARKVMNLGTSDSSDDEDEAYWYFCYAKKNVERFFGIFNIFLNFFLIDNCCRLYEFSYIWIYWNKNVFHQHLGGFFSVEKISDLKSNHDPNISFLFK